MSPKTKLKEAISQRNAQTDETKKLTDRLKQTRERMRDVLKRIKEQSVSREESNQRGAA